MKTLTTHVFNDGNSQAVRIPAEFRLDTDQVSISRIEQGDLVLHPLRADRGAALLDVLCAVSEVDDAMVAALEDGRDPTDCSTCSILGKLRLFAHSIG